MTSSWAERMSLPGPSNFASDVAADVDAGRSSLVLLPAYLVDSGAAEHIVEVLAHRAHSHDIDPTRGANSLTEAIGACFDPTERWQTSADAWRELAALTAWRGECVLIYAWDYDVGQLLARWSSLMSEQQTDPSERPRFLIISRRQDIDESVLTRIDLLHTSVRWWWNVIDRLDTEAALARRATTFQRDVLRRAIMAEIAGWDLDLADHLLSEWDGDMARLSAAVSDYAAPSDVTGLHDVDRRPAAAPISAERDGWDAGLIDVWGDARRLRPWALSESDLRVRVWRAQNRVFMPRLDERRAELEREFIRVAPRRVCDEVRNDEGVYELGPMRWAAQKFDLRLPGRSRSALTVLSRFRNCLAHGRAADDELLRQVRQHL